MPACIGSIGAGMQASHVRLHMCTSVISILASFTFQGNHLQIEKKGGPGEGGEQGQT